MTESGMDPVLLIAAPSWIVSEMATNLLQGEGIAILYHGQDRGMPEFGAIVNRMLARPDMYVQRAAFERANEILEEAWGPEWRKGPGPQASEESGEEPSDPCLEE